MTGSKIRSPQLRQSSPVVMKAGGSAIAPGLLQSLARLQDAARRDDKAAIAAMVRYPLRVNIGGDSRVYPDAGAVEEDYSRIFTPRVKRALLRQRPEKLRLSDDDRVTNGGGTISLSASCLDWTCSRVGPLLIDSVGP